MTAWGVVAVCGVGGGVAGPLLDSFARRVRRTVAPPAEVPVTADAAGLAPQVPLLPADGVQLAAAHAPLPDAATDPLAPSPSRRAVLAEGAGAALVTAAACALCAVRLGAVPQLAAYCALAGALVMLSITDLRTGLVPRRIVYVSSAVVGVALLAASGVHGTWRPMLDALIGAAIAFLIFALVWWISPKAMGFGDVRLAGLCGGALGWLGFAPLYLGFLAGFVAGALMGVAVLAARGRRRFPFAPSLALGTMFGVLWGAWLGGLWLHFR